MQQQRQEMADVFDGIKSGWEINAELHADVVRKAYDHYQYHYEAATDVIDATCPASRSLVFEAFKRISPMGVRVIIIGQDPYPRVEDACGISFQSTGPVVPHSARSIRANLVKYGHASWGSMPPTATLEGWIRQGVLMVNTSLTVSAGKPGSHRELWRGVVERILRAVPERSVTLCLGVDAATVHTPSRFAIHHSHPVLPSEEQFQTRDCFGEVNARLADLEMNPIDWSSMSGGGKCRGGCSMSDCVGVDTTECYACRGLFCGSHIYPIIEARGENVVLQLCECCLINRGRFLN